MQVAVHNPGKCGAFLRLGLVLANFVLPEGWAFANPGATPGLFTSTGLLTRNPNIKPHMEKFIEKASRLARLSRTRKTCRGFNFLFLDFMAIFLKLLIKRINLLMND